MTPAGARRPLAAALTTTALLILTPPVSHPAAAAMAVPEQTDQLEEIRVVARKREEPLEETPLSVTPLGQHLLEDAQVRQLDQVQDMVPNMTWNTGFSGVQGAISIRGVGKGAEDIVFDPGVGIYVDGILLSRDIGQLLPMLDVQQLEVLRGPQGTLFGKNTVGGAVNVRTVKPHNAFEAAAQIEYGNFYSLRTRATVNVPLIDEKLFARVNWASDQSEGYTHNTLLEQDASDRGLHAVMASLRALPHERLTLDVAGSWSRDHTHSRGGECVPLGTGVAAAAASLFIPGFAAALPAACAASSANGPFRFEASEFGIADVESYGVWGTIAADLGTYGIVEELVVKSITAWRQQIPRLRDDIDMTSMAVIQRSTTNDGPTWFPDERGRSEQRQITQELQLNNNWIDDAWILGHVHSVTGLYLYWDQATHFQEFHSLGNVVLSRGFFQGLAPSLQRTGIDNFDVAVYHQSTWDVLDWLSLTGGVRWTRESKDTDLVIYRFTAPPPVGIPRSPFVELATQEDVTFSEWTPTASLVVKMPDAWAQQLSHDAVNGYFTYSQGFKGGGFSALQGGTADRLVEFKPETLDSYEFGIKSTGWERRLRWSAAYFLAYYNDIQVTTTQAVAGSFVVDRVVENAAEATTQGIEFEFQLLPSNGLLLIGTFGWLDARYDSYPNSASNAPRPDVSLDPRIDRSGDRFAGVPEWKSNFSAQYEVPIDLAWPRWLDGVLRPRAEWIFESDIQYAGRELPALLQDSVHRLNARLGWSFNDEHTEIAIWGKNLTDAHYFRSVIEGTTPTYGIALRYYEAPRTYGFTLSHRF